ncbi:class A sortase [Staphylococcus pseudintermedius]|uniref:class A sortase n=1 Tax=Staphylococcus pseudintermedius TaxID=283734 RepID=UPI000809405C|nr:class A sortase [Staphylococcus pseudintermedius]ANS90070.1 Sortase A, LPXTG specific [Staphylococcus pseudintermedius]EGQ0315067.1 class A sortase [Staphylococcus pseudintermedius]EGQ0372921.1 class A sortase [Staphylococcus pseudintermedius]EGQ0384983.1 class A sortase [Staphylococcus pseudintermedius]EGQ0392229.1 class A sortase [Staphylococcus pseudintermedius]
MKYLIRAGVTILLILALLLVFHKPIINRLVAPYLMNHSYERISKEDFQKNDEYLKNHRTNPNNDISFDFKAVKPINLLDIKDVEFNSNYVVGKITIPSVHLNLPILYGVSNNNLWFGACTMKPNQKFGQGNFALAGHTMANQNLLFTPLHSIKKGDMIYITNGQNVYVYQTTNVEIVSPDHGEVINDTDESTITLVTCSDVYGKERLIVQGQLLATEATTKKNLNIFNI